MVNRIQNQKHLKNLIRLYYLHLKQNRDLNVKMMVCRRLLRVKLLGDYKNFFLKFIAIRLERNES